MSTYPMCANVLQYTDCVSKYVHYQTLLYLSYFCWGQLSVASELFDRDAGLTIF